MNKSYYSGNNSVRIKQALLKRDVGHFLNPSFNRIKKRAYKNHLLCIPAQRAHRAALPLAVPLFDLCPASAFCTSHSQQHRIYAPQKLPAKHWASCSTFFPGCHSQPNPAFYFRMTKVSPFTLFRFRYWILLILLCVLAGTYAVCLQAFRLRTYGGELTIAALQLRVGIDFSFVFLSWE